ncbi:MAG TPA: hypothetical protein VHY80_12010, partial [Stellaceae bacterium]|nr:hypothetical protein [Stellaceae bacterium]
MAHSVTFAAAEPVAGPRVFFLTLVLIAILSLLMPAVAAAQTAKLAAALSLTGSDAVFGVDARDGATLAVEEANKAGVAPPIELSVYDDASDLGRGHAVTAQI